MQDAARLLSVARLLEDFEEDVTTDGLDNIKPVIRQKHALRPCKHCGQLTEFVYCDAQCKIDFISNGDGYD